MRRGDPSACPGPGALRAGPGRDQDPVRGAAVLSRPRGENGGMPSPISRVTPSALYWFGLGCLLFTVVAFVVAFAGGNSGGAGTAMTVFVLGFVAASVGATVTAVVALAGIVAFASARPRFVGLLLLSVLCHPLLWLGLIASVL